MEVKPIATATHETLQLPETLPVARSLSFTAATSPADTPLSGHLGQTLSMPNLRKRVARMMKPKADGSYKIPKELIDEWEKGDQDKLLQDFQRSGLDKDCCGPKSNNETMWRLSCFFQWFPNKVLAHARMSLCARL